MLPDCQVILLALVSESSEIPHTFVMASTAVGHAGICSKSLRRIGESVFGVKTGCIRTSAARRHECSPYECERVETLIQNYFDWICESLSPLRE